MSRRTSKKLHIAKKQKIKPFKGDHIFNKEHWFSAFISGKFAGKTTLLNNLIREFGDDKVKFIIFAPTGTFNDCHVWADAKRYMKKKKLEYQYHPSLFHENGLPILADYMEEDKEDENEQYEEEQFQQKDPDLLIVEQMLDIMGRGKPPKIEEKIEKKEEDKKIKKIFIIDDLAHELRKKGNFVDRLSKNHRHKLNANICILTQYLKDLAPDVCCNIDYLFMFYGIPIDVLKDTYGRIPCAVSKKEFINKYLLLANKVHQFCLSDLERGTFRNQLER